MDTATRIPFKSVTEFKRRPVSISEYYHASVGKASKSLEVPRECIFIIEGSFEHGISQEIENSWKQALRKVTEANPGTRLQLQGSGIGSVWSSTGEPPRLRVVHDNQWDGLSDIGSEFITAEPLDLQAGPCVELLLVDGSHQFVILRMLHAIADGMGGIHLLLEIFRALRGEPLEGTNIALTDLEIMQNIEKAKSPPPKGVPPYATGGPRGEQTGDCWRSIRLQSTQPKLLARVMLAVANTAAQYSDKPARIALPVDLRRHFPGLKSTMNYTSMLHMDVHPEDTPDEVTKNMKDRLSKNLEAGLPRFLNVLKILPMGFIDRVVSRSPANFTKRKLLETAVISSPGLIKPGKLSCDSFAAQRMFTVPIPGNTMISILNLGRETTITVGTENIYATDGRLDTLLKNITEAVSR